MSTSSDSRSQLPSGFGLGHVASVGLKPGTPGDVQRRVAVSNLFASTTALVTLPWAVVFFALAQTSLGGACALVAILCLGTIGWNALGMHLLARLWLTAWSNLSILGFSVLLGLDSGVHLLFMATTCAPLALFDAREHRLSFVFGVITPVAMGAAVQRFGMTHAPLLPLTDGTLAYLYPGLLATTVLILLAIISYYYYAHDRTRLARERQHHRTQAALDSALRESELRYALASEASNDGLWDWDAATDELYYSPPWKALLGYTDEEVGTSFAEWLDRVHPDDRPRVEQEIEDHMLGRSERLRSEHRILDKSGRYRWFLTKGRAVRDEDGMATRMAGWLIDVTERRAAEEKLRASEQRFRQLVSHVADALYLITLDGEIADVNERAQTELGYSHEQLCGRTIFQIDPELDLSELRRVHAQASDQGTVTLERNHMRSDGTLYPVELRLGCVRFRGRDHLLASARDMTQRKQIEARLMLADRMVSVGTLAAGVAHEINNPLTSLMLNLELIDRQLADVAQKGGSVASDERLLRALCRAREGGERVGVIVRDLKTFSRGDEDVSEPVDLRRVVESTLSLAHPELKRRAEVKFEFEDELPRVRANEARLGQVVLNLVLNAAHAFDGDGTDRSHQIRLCLQASAEQGFVEVLVSDNGHGIDPAVMPRIFDPFFTTKPVGVGTGLGLFICRNIVESCEGTLTVRSEPEVGTTFCVRLPEARPITGDYNRVVVQSAAGPVQRDALAFSVPPPPGLPRARILVVDDDPTVGHTLQDVLSDHDVRVARDVETALVMLQRTDPFDLVLCERRLDECQQPSLHSRVRELAPDNVGRWVAMSGDPAQRPTPGVLEKPVRSEALWALLGGQEVDAVQEPGDVA